MSDTAVVDPTTGPSVESDIDTGRSVETGEFAIFVNGEEVWSTDRSNVRSVSMRTANGEISAARVAGGAVTWMDILVDIAVPEDSNLPFDMVERNRALARQDQAVEVADQVSHTRTLTRAEKDREEDIDNPVTNPDSTERLAAPEGDEGPGPNNPETQDTENVPPQDGNPNPNVNTQGGTTLSGRLGFGR